MSRLIVGDSIIHRKLFKPETAQQGNLKNSTYDLRVGKIIRLGHENAADDRRYGDPQKHIIQPKEMIFVVSKEHFTLPMTVTGLATLRTSLTKKGLLTLSVGIIDPGYNGPVSTSLLNFSDRPVLIHVDESFFRVLFFDHASVANHKPLVPDSPASYDAYVREIEELAHASFPKTYLNLPSQDESYLYRLFWNVLSSLFGLDKLLLLALLAAIGAFLAWGPLGTFFSNIMELI